MPPYSGRLVRMTSPGSVSARIEVKIAAMPLENTEQASAPSRIASRSSTIWRLGLLNRV